MIQKHANSLVALCKILMETKLKIHLISPSGLYASLPCHPQFQDKVHQEAASQEAKFNTVSWNIYAVYLVIHASSVLL